MIDVCYVVSFGFAARMLFQTGLITKLTEAGKSVAIVIPDPNDENLKEFQDNPLVHIFAGGEKSSIWNEDYLFKRKYYLEDIKANPALWEKHIYHIRYSTSLHPWRRLRPFLYGAIHKLVKIFPSIKKRFLKNEEKYLYSEEANDLLDKIKPKLVVSTYPVNFLEAKILFAAKQKEIPTLLHLLSWDNITSKGKFPVVSDYHIVWGDVMQTELLEYYPIPEDKIYKCGVPHFDNHIRYRGNQFYKEILSDFGLNPEAPYLMFAMSAKRFSPYEIDIVQWLAKRIEAGDFGNDLQLIIRPHPQNIQGNMANQVWIKRLMDLKSNRVAVDIPRLLESKVKWSLQKEDMNYLSSLLSGCSVCINSGSTISIETLLFEKPVLLTSFDANEQVTYWKSARRLIDYTHLKKFIGLGGATVTRSFEEMKQHILAYLENPQLDQEKRKFALEQQCYKNDGNATERVVEAVVGILEEVE